MRILLAAIYPYVFLLLYLLIPFDNYVRVLPNILMAILVIAFPLVVKRRDFNRLKSPPAAALLIFVLYLLVNSLAGGRFAEDFNIIKKILLAVGLVILYIPVNDEEKINRAIVFSALAAILFTVYNFVIITHASGNFAFGDSPELVESLLIDRMYLGILSAFSILISFKSLQSRYHPINNYHLANILINLAFMVLIVSKISIIALIILLIVKQFYGSRSIWKPIWAGLAFAGLLGLFLLPASEPAYNDAALSQSSKVVTPKVLQNSMTYALRSEIWLCGKTILESEGFSLTGMGFETTNSKLLSCYGTQIQNPQKRERFIKEEYNTHSQFLDFYMSAGFLALLLFLLFIGVSYFWNRKEFFPTAMLVLFIVYCSVENLFHRQIGGYYVGFILIALLLGSRSRENTEIK